MIKKIVVIIIALILVLLIINGIIKLNNANDLEYYNEKEKLMIKASEKYFSFYSNYLPKKVNDDTRVLLSALVLEKYLDDVKDIDGNSCDITKSYVEVEKTKEDEYLYKAHLVCDNYETKDGE